MTDTYTARLTADGYELFLYGVPPLTAEFIRAQWGVGTTAATMQRRLAANGYRPAEAVNDELKGRVIGHQSTLRYISELRWTK